MRAKCINEVQEFQRGQDPKSSMKIGVMNNPRMLLDKFIKDFSDEFGIELIPENWSSGFDRLIQEGDVMGFSFKFIRDPILNLITDDDDHLVIILTEDAAQRIFEDSKLGWAYLHKSPSAFKRKVFDFRDVYFLPDIIKKIRKLRRITDLAVDDMIGKRQKQIDNLKKIKSFK